MKNINIISFFTGKILKKFPLLKETFVVVYFVDYPGLLSAASLAVTGIISCEKEPDTETPVPVESVSLDKNVLAFVLGIDETKTLTATVYP